MIRKVIGKDTKNMKENNLLEIGQLAKQTGELTSTIRFWTKEGLLVVKGYSDNGYRLYHPSMIERVKVIRKLQQETCLPIAEIRNRLNQE